MRLAPSGHAVIPPQLLFDLAAGRWHDLDVAVILTVALMFSTRWIDPRAVRYVTWTDDGATLLVARGTPNLGRGSRAFQAFHRPRIERDLARSQAQGQYDRCHFVATVDSSLALETTKPCF